MVWRVLATFVAGVAGLGVWPSGLATAAGEVEAVTTFASTPIGFEPYDAVYDENTGLVLAIGTMQGERDVLVAFDPQDGAVSWDLALGDLAGSIAVSADGSLVYVGTGYNITVVDTASTMISATHSLGTGVCGPRSAHDIVVLPGDATSIVVAVGGNCGDNEEVLLMTGGSVAAATVAPSTPVTHLAAVSDALVVGVAPDERCGCHHRLAVSPDGVRVLNTVGSNLEIDGGVAAADGVVYGNGRGVDLDTGEVVFQTGPVSSTMTPTIDGEVLYLETGSTAEFTSAISAFDRSTGQQLGDEVWVQADFGITAMLATPSGLLFWEGERFLLEGEEPPAPTWDIEVTVWVDLRGTDYVLTVDPPETCVNVYDADSEELIASASTSDLRVNLTLPQVRVKILGWDCNRWGLFPEWHGDVMLGDWDNATIIDLANIPEPGVEIYLDPFFFDVPFDTYYFESTIFMKNAGITTGCSKLFYCPEEEVTRGQMAAFMARFWRATGRSCASSDVPFSDVGTWHFAYAEVACIVDLGITTGLTPERYAPEDPVTRQQMAAFLARLWRAAGQACPTGSHPFHDVAPTSFAGADIACIFHLGVTTGTSATTYEPSAPVTRAQMAAFLDRLFVAVIDA